MEIITLARLVATAAGAVALGAINAINQSTPSPPQRRKALAYAVITPPDAPQPRRSGPGRS